jgi:transcriptional regulator with XRE-family HTH domain
MRARFGGMTLQTLLQRHGITTIKELSHRTGLSRQQSWNLWHGRVGVGKATAKRLYERLGIPAEQLLQIDPIPAIKQPNMPPPRPRGRPPWKARTASTTALPILAPMTPWGCWRRRACSAIARWPGRTIAISYGTPSRRRTRSPAPSALAGRRAIRPSPTQMRPRSPCKV